MTRLRMALWFELTDTAISLKQLFWKRDNPHRTVWLLGAQLSVQKECISNRLRHFPTSVWHEKIVSIEHSWVWAFQCLRCQEDPLARIGSTFRAEDTLALLSFANRAIPSSSPGEMCFTASGSCNILSSSKQTCGFIFYHWHYSPFCALWSFSR